ncbi:hypothetical protein FGO68_gene17255 [Halteria grandinella]|uniref:Transmembrane protein n=1 Tax=Halteria grandinella TaxID=5974 RepID=A0A8J8NHM3_HALGN|nr:hypothetical protein FGO68_gene17255 [Halteria grandinella]
MNKMPKKQYKKSLESFFFKHQIQMQTQFLKAKNFIKNLDQFGVVFKPSITQDTEYKTVLGGILSIILYGVSLGYFIQQLVQWQQGQLLPKITISSEVISDQKYYFSNPILSIQMNQFGDNSIDPFDPQNLILMPLMVPIVNGIFIEPTLPNITKNGEFTTVYFQNFTLSISSQKSTENPELGLSIVLVDCVQGFLTSGLSCANTTLKQQFFNQTVNQVFFSTYINEFNAQQESLNTFASSISLALDNTTYTMLRILQNCRKQQLMMEYFLKIHIKESSFLMYKLQVNNQIANSFLAQQMPLFISLIAINQMAQNPFNIYNIQKLMKFQLIQDPSYLQFSSHQLLLS